MSGSIFMISGFKASLICFHRQAHSAQVEEGGDHRVSKQQLDKLIKEQKGMSNLRICRQYFLVLLW